MIYEFFWGKVSRRCLIKIESSSIGATEPEAIQRLLDEYRGSLKYYNIDGWCSFLEGKGYKVEKVDSDYSLEF